MTVFLFAVMLIHGLIHLMGFAKAFEYAEISQLRLHISRPAGSLWLLCCVAFLSAGVLYLSKSPWWWWIALPSALVSQALIFGTWSDAKFGTVANLIILVAVISAALESRPGSYRSRYAVAVRESLPRSVGTALVSEQDLAHLPPSVQKYLRVSGCVGKSRIHNFRIVFTGKFRSGLTGPWMAFRSEQFNNMDEPERAFLMKARMYGIPTEGFHLFQAGRATMQIKLASLFQLVDASGPQMDQGETVTFFNDLCLFAPAALIDPERIHWEADGPLSAKATFRYRGNTIRARLTFNEAGDLTDFVSDDRFLSADGKTFQRYPWSTPVKSWRDTGGRRVPASAETIWHMPDGAFCYGKFMLSEIEYNVAVEFSR
jgi:hypothetical protein